jgi:hypothetical protein
MSCTRSGLSDMCGKWGDICCCCGRAVVLLLLLLLVGSAVHVRTTVYFLFKVPVRLYRVVVRKEIGGRSNI